MKNGERQGCGGRVVPSLRGPAVPRTGMLSRPVCNRGGLDPPMRPVAAEASPRASEVKDCPILSEMARDGAGVFSSGMLHRNRERNHLQFCSVSSPKSFTV